MLFVSPLFTPHHSQSLLSPTSFGYISTLIALHQGSLCCEE